MDNNTFHIVSFGGSDGGVNGYTSIAIAMLDDMLDGTYEQYTDLPDSDKAILIMDTLRNGISDGIRMYLTDTIMASITYAALSHTVDDVSVWVDKQLSNYKNNGGRSDKHMLFENVELSLDFVEAVISGDHYVDQSDGVSFDMSYLTQKELDALTTESRELSADESEQLISKNTTIN